ncbi:phosphotransferase family protein [Nocardioides panacisoli]|uniref:phosphotransferase family protein n=1 Tax=Nocardioides panacisoli TaxID=627624 RepID=UPI001C6281D3|nr:phosphotransferase family protein [Nocardioides panacisoli]QYJ02561.1 phosphotransferase family protein [Nocardioides panacisoli]
MSDAPPPADLALQRTSRDADGVRVALEEWLAGVLPPGAGPRVTLHEGVDSNGMSSETVVLDVAWLHDGAPRVGEYVVRVAPAAADVPVFPDYRLDDQYDAMRLARELTDVPVPRVRWLEPTGDVLGTPFFFMDRVPGRVPPDVLPYTFGDNWFADATAVNRGRLQRATVEVIARLHGIPEAPERFAFLDPARGGHDGDTVLARNLARTRAWYEFGAQGLGRSPLVERGLAWLAANEPATDAPVLCWGDARIGNVLYDGFEPAAVLDWEMATLGPREMDLAWLVFAHRVFDEIATALGLPGLPDVLRPDDVVAAYADRTGVTVGDLTWHQVHAAVQWCCVFLRTSVRQVHFGEIEQPEDVESVYHHRPLVERLLEEVGA